MSEIGLSVLSYLAQSRYGHLPIKLFPVIFHSKWVQSIFPSHGGINPALGAYASKIV
jgi:hypothetical protein